MNIIIHRGIDQIGGCITEISTRTSRIFIDMGENLSGEDNMSNADKREYVNSLFTNNSKENQAVFYTHAHADHIGMIAYVPNEVPQYMSEGTKKHCQLKYKLLSTLDDEENNDLYEFAKLNLEVLEKAVNIGACEVNVGDIVVTAYAVPHSAHGSIMLLVEADGKRVLHTGDFKRKGLEADFIDQIKRLGQVDVVITEGTMLKRTQTLKSEDDVRRQMAEVMQKHKYVFVLTSSLNYDRLSSVSLAALENDKPLTTCSSMMLRSIQAYQKERPEKFGEHVMFYPFTDDFDNWKKRKFEAWVNKNGFVQCVGIGQLDKVKEILELYPSKDCALIYSMWQGHYKIPAQVQKDPRYKRYRELFEHVYDIHTSGHADSATIAEMLTLLNPTEGIIGIHKEAGASLSTLDIPEELKAKIIPEGRALDYVTLR